MMQHASCAARPSSEGAREDEAFRGEVGGEVEGLSSPRAAEMGEAHLGDVLPGRDGASFT